MALSIAGGIDPTSWATASG